MATTAASVVATNIHCKARTRRKLARKAIEKGTLVICFLPGDHLRCWEGYQRMVTGNSSPYRLSRFNVANFASLCHKPELHRPADQGLPCRCPCRLSHFRNNQALSTL